MNSPNTTRSVSTIRDALVRALRDAATQYNPMDLEAPVAVLWTDSDAPGLTSLKCLDAPSLGAPRRLRCRSGSGACNLSETCGGRTPTKIDGRDAFPSLSTCRVSLEDSSLT